VSPEAELNYLRKISEALVLVMLPKYYTRAAPVRHLLTEVLATTGTGQNCVRNHGLPNYTVKDLKKLQGL